MPEVLTRVPMFFNGPKVIADPSAHFAHVSLVDIMPTLCEAVGATIPHGVQGRSLWPLLTGGPYPEEEFASVYAEQGFGGRHYNEEDDPASVVHCWDFDPASPSFDELNSFTQSGTMRMVRKGDWKLIFDMMGNGQLYNLAMDPFELDNLIGQEMHLDTERYMLHELLTWTLRAQDPLPVPRSNWIPKCHPKNYWTENQVIPKAVARKL